MQWGSDRGGRGGIIFLFTNGRGSLHGYPRGVSRFLLSFKTDGVVINEVTVIHLPIYYPPQPPSHLLPCLHTSMVTLLNFPLRNSCLAFSVSVYNLHVSSIKTPFRWARLQMFTENQLERLEFLALIVKLPLALMLRRGKLV